MQQLDPRELLDPSSIYRPAPLWVWNDLMSKGQLAEQLGELKAHGFGGAFVHPRPGLVTEYLSEEWFDRWRDALEEAKRLGLKLYIYDENSYPSGFAGGHVPAELPDCLANAVIVHRWDLAMLARETNAAFPMLNRPGHPIRAYAYEEDADTRLVAIGRDVTNLPKSEWPQYGSRFLVFELGTPETDVWLGGFAYADLFRPEVTERFIESTYEAYAARFGADFGVAIPAIFTDEPVISSGNLLQDNGHFLPFSYWFAAQFELRNGYDLKDCLPALFMNVRDGNPNVDAAKVRYDYYRTIHELWVRNSVIPLSEWCGSRGIAYTGHYLEHNWPYPWGRASPSLMSLYEFMHWPAIDMLMTYLLRNDGTEAHLMITIREAHSAANQFSKQRVLCEAYGAGGWDSTFEDYKRIGDWLFVHGITFLNQHLTFSTIAGARKRDHPQSFDWRQPWWDEYRHLNDYYARLSLLLSEGDTYNRMLVLNPTTSAYLLTPDHANPGLAPDREDAFMRDARLFQQLCDWQWDYDFGDEYILGRHGQAQAGQLIVKDRRYEVVLVPNAMTNLQESTFRLLASYLQSGGCVISLSAGPDRIEGAIDERTGQLRLHPNWRTVRDVESLELALKERIAPRVEFDWDQASPVQGVAHLRRVQPDGSIHYFLANSGNQAVNGSMYVDGSYAEEVDLWEGCVRPLACDRVQGRRLEIPVELPASGSFFIRVCPAAPEMATQTEGGSARRIQSRMADSVAHAPLTVRAESPNYLIIDYCDLEIGSKLYHGIHTPYAGTKVFEHRGFAANPWDNAVQYKRRLLDRNRFYGENSGFTVTYRFEVQEGARLSDVRLLVEKAESYRIFVNEQPVAPGRYGMSKLDHHILEADIASYLRDGENIVTLRADRFDVQLEVESIYLHGDFGVFQEQERWVIGRPVPTLALGHWRDQGYPFYNGAIRYERTIELEEEAPGGICVELPQWEGTVASIWLNDKMAGLIGIGQGNKLTIGTPLPQGAHEVSVRVCGSFKNLLGPHHDPDRPRRLAWPGNWKKAPLYGPPAADAYDLIDYGLMKDFKVTRNVLEPSINP